MKQTLKKLAPFLLAALLGAALYWVHDVYIYVGLGAEFAAASVLSVLLFAALLLLSGRKWPHALGWIAAFLAVEQGALALLNYVVFPAGTQPRFAMRVMLPVLILVAVLALIKPWRALLPWKTRRWIVLPLAAAVCIGGGVWAAVSLMPLEEFTPAPEPQPAAVEKHSIADYKIIYGQYAPETAITAANIMADTLRQITGLEYSAQQESDPKQIIRPAIYVAQSADYGIDGYRIIPDGDRIIIYGGQRGVIYGVYHFLEEYFDCHWYTSELIVIPEGPAEIAPVKEENYAPSIEYRETDWISPRDSVFSVANGLNGNVYRTLGEELGGMVGYNGSMCHSIINYFLKPDDHFEAHPEWYALRGGERVPKQLCLTNPEVLEEMIRQVREQLETGNGQRIVSVTQDDNQDYCQCGECKRVDAEEGSHAGTMLRFVNAIAQDIKDDYPEALIDTFAYQYTRTPPKLAKPLPNVIVRLCSIECCFAHPLDDPECAENLKFAQDIKGWSEICDRLYIWDYTTNYAHYNCIFPDFGVLQRNMQFFVENNVKGVYEEGNYHPECDSEFAGLRAYLLARLMFNPYIDYDAEMNGFLRAYYGGGWQYMRVFIDLTTESTGNRWPHEKLGIFDSPTDKDVLKLRPNQVAWADKLWGKTVELAGSDECEQNVLRSQLSWRYWKAWNKVSEFSRLQLPGKWMTENERLFNDFKAFGVNRYSEGNMFAIEPPGNWWGTPETWRDPKN